MTSPTDPFTIDPNNPNGTSWTSRFTSKQNECSSDQSAVHPMRSAEENRKVRKFVAEPCGTQKYRTPAWRIIPFSKWLITMVIVSPLTGVVPLTNGLNGL